MLRKLSTMTIIYIRHRFLNTIHCRKRNYTLTTRSTVLPSLNHGLPCVIKRPSTAHGPSSRTGPCESLPHPRWNVDWFHHGQASRASTSHEYNSFAMPRRQSLFLFSLPQALVHLVLLSLPLSGCSLSHGKGAQYRCTT